MFYENIENVYRLTFPNPPRKEFHHCLATMTLIRTIQCRGTRSVFHWSKAGSRCSCKPWVFISNHFLKWYSFFVRVLALWETVRISRIRRNQMENEMKRLKRNWIEKITVKLISYENTLHLIFISRYSDGIGCLISKQVCLNLSIFKCRTYEVILLVALVTSCYTKSIMEKFAIWTKTSRKTESWMLWLVLFREGWPSDLKIGKYNNYLI